MGYIVAFLMVGAIAIMILGGNNGMLHTMVTGTTTADFMVKAGTMLAIALACIVMVIFRVVGGRKNKP